MKKHLLLMAFIAISFTISAQSAGPQSGTLFQTLPLTGAEVTWSKVSYASGSDDANAIFDKLSNTIGSHTDYLVITGFKFDLPYGSRITGIEVFVESSDESESTADNSVRLVKNGAVVGVDHSEGDMYFNINIRDHYNIYGGPHDLWGEDWNLKDIMDEGFGIALSAKRAVLGPTTSGAIDDVRINIHYAKNLTTLPLKLISFSANSNGENVMIKWQTIDESAMDHFEIERSSNGSSYSSLGNVPCLNRQIHSQYSFEDANPIPGTGWYRLKIVGMDGSISYSKIITIYSKGKINNYLFPSPWNKGSSLFIRNPANERLKIIFYSATGEKLTSVSTTNHLVPAPTLGKATGGLHYKIYNENDQVTGSGKIVVF
jgi:hypothetical protein